MATADKILLGYGTCATGRGGHRLGLTRGGSAFLVERIRKLKQTAIKARWRKIVLTEKSLN